MTSHHVAGMVEMTIRNSHPCPPSSSPLLSPIFFTPFTWESEIPSSILNSVCAPNLPQTPIPFSFLSGILMLDGNFYLWDV
mmetsp:Transcript_19252/g.31509  ORF Transcript_19252/g.31509 Transcript_19252/m.31509 type:complete len:81 (+) Transcript_19252:1767-2009(+)